ncbi:P-loop containing nucleoside triphosphate hydrolases superfamily protein [Striga hermonthica]|uniref:P-loop containing nucleoside triphosphate hydrolases superfamily protein n=1 Tax=Striga hermonthica TaxID=68872 RepID=A0A9N7RFQ5_STRHE|nr:P-loop containing nucleoside triphosphate hydrolases superfamily protein [Striga hermonthica]
MVVLIFVMVCGVYICSLCLKQISVRSSSNGPLSSFQVATKPCEEATDIEPSENPYVHFPKPKTFSRKECECSPVRYFAILSTQRSGSGWFETLLNSHMNISSNGEIFSVKVRRSNVSTIVETLDQIYNLDWFTSASKNECTAAVGLKWMLNQGLMQHHEEIVEYFKSRGVSAIFLFRKNLLRRMISVLANSYDQNAKPLNGTHKSHVHSPHEAEILASYKPTINTTLLLPNLMQVEDMVNKSLQYFNSTRHIILYYEDIIKNRTKLLDVQNFLRVPIQKLNSRQVKIHKGSLSSQVENWGEIENALKGTRYESFLNEDYKFGRRLSSLLAKPSGPFRLLVLGRVVRRWGVSGCQRRLVFWLPVVVGIRLLPAGLVLGVFSWNSRGCSGWFW